MVWSNTKMLLGEIPKATQPFTGNQLRAARALLGVDQESFAAIAGVSDNTIRNMEACGSQVVRGLESTRNKVLAALKARGVQLLNGGRPGVRLVPLPLRERLPPVPGSAPWRK
jgi:DNA-binding transcriptional regulator YiaG